MSRCYREAIKSHCASLLGASIRWIRQAEHQNPYKLSIVDSVEAYTDKFYTLSTNGLVFSSGGRTEFFTVDQFERQYA